MCVCVGVWSEGGIKRESEIEGVFERGRERKKVRDREGGCVWKREREKGWRRELNRRQIEPFKIIQGVNVFTVWKEFFNS